MTTSRQVSLVGDLQYLFIHFLQTFSKQLQTALGNFAAGIVDAGLVPLADIPIEVAKVLFLNNAVNHGVLTPLGAAQAAEEGQYITCLNQILDQV